MGGGRHKKVKVNVVMNFFNYYVTNYLEVEIHIDCLLNNTFNFCVGYIAPFPEFTLGCNLSIPMRLNGTFFHPNILSMSQVI